MDGLLAFVHCYTDNMSCRDDVRLVNRVPLCHCVPCLCLQSFVARKEILKKGGTCSSPGYVRSEECCGRCFVGLKTTLLPSVGGMLRRSGCGSLYGGECRGACGGPYG